MHPSSCEPSRRSFIIRSAGAALAAFALPLDSNAESTFPSHFVRLIVPFPAGGAGDIVARTLAPGLGQALGQAIVVDDKGGGAQVIATDLAAKAAPDGYTLFLASLTHAINPALIKNLPYDTIGDFAALTVPVSSPLVYVAHPSAPFSTMSELVAYAKANPGKLNYGTSGAGSGSHLAVELFKYQAGLDMVAVHYKGAAPAITDLIGGQIQMMCTSPLAAMPHVRARQLRALAMTSTKRSSIAPELPTVAESGFPEYQASAWYALLTQSRTPPDVRERLHDAAIKTLRNPEVVAAFRAQSADIVASTPDEATAFIRAELARWTKVIEKAGIKGEA